MEIKLCDDNVTNLTFKIDIQKLKRTILHFNLGMGTFYKPIPVDSFIESVEQKSTVFTNKILMKMSCDPSNEKDESIPAILFCKICNIGRKFNYNLLSSLNPWEGVFKDSKNITPAPDGILFINPNSTGEYEIMIENEGVEEEPKITYVSYSVIFSLLVEIEVFDSETEEMKKQTQNCFFIFDPSLSVSSNPPPPLKK